VTPRSLRIADAVFVAAALLGAAYLVAHLLLFRFGFDQGVYALCADALLDGKLPYRDVWDFKPPGIYFVYAIGRALSRGAIGVRAVEAASLASLVWGSALLARQRLGDARPGLVGGALAVLAHVQLDFWHTAQPEGFAAVALVWALVAAGDDAPALRLVAAGALYGFAALLKPPCGGGLVVSAVALAWRRRSRGPLAALAPALLLVAGAALALAATGLFFVARGGWPALQHTLFEFVPRYLDLAHRDVLGQTVHALAEWLFGFEALIGIGLALALALPRGPREAGALAELLGVAGACVVGVALQGKFYDYHFGAALPLGAIAAGWGLWKLWRLGEGRRRVAAMALTLALVAALRDPGPSRREHGFWQHAQARLFMLAHPELRPVISPTLASALWVDDGANRAVARFLDEHTPPDAAIFVWGFESTIYLEAARRPASRYVYDAPQRCAWERAAARAQLMRDLSATPPAAIVVEHRDFCEPILCSEDDSATLLDGFAELRALLDHHYRLATEIGALEVWLRTPA
jgi:hypothetical protein